MNIQRPTGKEWTAHVVAILLVLLFGVVSVLSITGFVDLKDPAVSLFVGSLVGTIAGLLASPVVFYYGSPPMIKRPEEKENGTGQ